MVGARGLAKRALVALHKDPHTRLRDQLERGGLHGRELAFAYELAHGVVRRERLIDSILEGVVHRALPSGPALKVVLRLGVYQLLFLPGMPSHAAVHETVGLVRQNRGFANALLRRVAGMICDVPADPARPRDELPLDEHRSFRVPRSLPEDEVERSAVLHSVPEWLARRITDQHGPAGFAQVAEAASAKPTVYLRSRGPADALAAELQAEGVEVDARQGSDLLAWTGGGSPFDTGVFRRGAFVAQDPTAVAAARALPCSRGDRVIDLCAAPGTKTTLLADRVGSTGKVYAYDPDDGRRQRIVENVERTRLSDVVEVVADKRSLRPADGVLADVPCSNTGVLGRRVEVRGRLAASIFEGLCQLQGQILREAIELARPGGHVVYSTCSIDDEENHGVVDEVVAERPDVTLLESCLTLPRQGRHDGGYFAVLRRSG